ncbi:response regulator [Paenibacillus sp. CF384]|uniref:response regulator n=1 Tax=Paenibacillus sp. CF384 TaxID=1884382 RepID=UPI000898197C|nr:response regulator [Paenibacillus sp. CF384]SDW48422.1 two-component system, response regulator YesN [Paenibacillus sp. CF384]
MIRALIVDDESLVRRGVRFMLPWEKFGISVDGEASNGEKALLYLEQNQVELLITDLTMPGMTGLELMEAVEKRFPRVAIVVLTCHRDFEYIQEAMRLGAIDYIVKTQLESQDLDELLERIVKRMGRVKVRELEATSSQIPLMEKPDESSKQDQLLQAWSSLQWVIVAGKHREIADRIAEFVLSWANRKAMLTSLHAVWVARLPWVAEYEGQARIHNASDWAELREWLKEFQLNVQTRLRNMLYSEDILSLILRSLDEIHRSAGQKITQATICSELHLSRSYFSRSFKDIVGTPFVSYVQFVNIRYAQYLLESTNYPVYVISDNVGFQDERYFSKVFKEKTGMLPTEYRISLRDSSSTPQ